MDSNDDRLKMKVAPKGKLPEITESDIMTVLLDPERYIEIYCYPKNNNNIQCIYFYVCRNTEMSGLIVSCRWDIGMPLDQGVVTDIDAVLKMYEAAKDYWRRLYGFK